MRVVSFLLLSAATAIAEPHPHRGVVQPYQGAPPAVPLSAEQLTVLERGEAVHEKLRMEDGGRGVAVMHVQAPASIVWAKIADYPSYPEWVDHLHTCEVYAREGDHVLVRFAASGLGIGAEWFVDHTYNRPAGWVTWTLDYDRKSDIYESVGFWRVTELSTEPALTRVEYSVELRSAPWVPGFLEDMIASQGLETATAWVKEQAEREHGGR